MVVTFRVLFLAFCAIECVAFINTLPQCRYLDQSNNNFASVKIRMEEKNFGALSDSVEYDIRAGLQEELSMIFSRSTEIGSILVGLLVPLLSSATSFAIQKSSEGNEEMTWEEFWLSESEGGDKVTISNADRLLSAVEKLGPTYVKFGQAIASRPDIIPKSLTKSLSSLQDNMEAFDTDIAKQVIEKELKNVNVDDGKISTLLESLPLDPIAAASVGQVYKGYLPSFGYVAVKVQRPGLKAMVQKDLVLLRKIATFVESIPSPTSNGRLVNTELVSAVDEFMSRIFEELNYSNEAVNAKKFARLYSNKYGSAMATSPRNGVVVPEIVDDLCTENVLVMEWIDGSKLASFEEETSSLDSEEMKENLILIEQALHVTLSQLLEFGVMHADPHNGNLLKVQDGNDSKATLGYLDFGLVATIPSTVRDGLVCAVAQLIFSKDVEAVASLFGELDLIEDKILLDSKERLALTEALTRTMQEVLVYPDGESIMTPTRRTNKRNTHVPTLKFDKLLDNLVRLVPRFKFQLPPYFINNARALGTLEGTAKTLDPNFNAFSMMYPFALNRIMRNPTGSPVVDATLQKLVRCTETGQIDRHKAYRLLSDSAALTGLSRRKVLRDVLKTKNGRRLCIEIIGQGIGSIARFEWLLGSRRYGTVFNFLQL